MKKIIYNCTKGESVEVVMTPEELAEIEAVANIPPVPTQEELLMLALSDTQMKLAEQQALTDQLALAFSEMQLGGTSS